MKKSTKSALKSSLKTEEEHIVDRFAKADSLLFKPSEQSTSPKIKPAVIVVRDTFSMTQEDNELVGGVRLKCMRAGIDTTRSEVVRAGIHLLSRLSQDELERAVSKVEKLKPGRAKQPA